MEQTQILETDLAYLAGLIDGEGTLDVLLRSTPSMQKEGKGYGREFRLNVTIASKELLQNIHAYLGNVGNIQLHKTAGYQAGFNNKTRINVYSLRFGANALRFLLPRLNPYLHLKKEAAEYMLRMLTYITETEHSKIKEITLLKMDLEFRKMRVATPGSKSKFVRKDDVIRNKILSDYEHDLKGR